jgi:pantothenate kinase
MDIIKFLREVIYVAINEAEEWQEVIAQGTNIYKRYEKEIKILDTKVTIGLLPRIQHKDDDESLYPETIAFELFVEFNLDGERILIPFMSNLSPTEIKNKILNWII